MERLLTIKESKPGGHFWEGVLAHGGLTFSKIRWNKLYLLPEMNYRWNASGIVFQIFSSLNLMISLNTGIPCSTFESHGTRLFLEDQTNCTFSLNYILPKTIYESSHYTAMSICENKLPLYMMLIVITIIKIILIMLQVWLDWRNPHIGDKPWHFTTLCFSLPRVDSIYNYVYSNRSRNSLS